MTSSADLERIGADERGRGLYLLSTPSWAEWPVALNLPEGCFCLLILADATNVDASIIARIAEDVLSSGCAHLSAWGPGCELVHDVFDNVFVGDGTKLDQKPHVMTTWHDSESLEQALWFLLDLAVPDESFGETCPSLVVAVVGIHEWKARVRDYLMNPPALRKAVLS